MKNKLTNRHLKDLLPSALKEIERKREIRPDLVLSGWGLVVDEKWRSMTKAVSFEKGVLVVKVRNTALLSLLVQHEKQRLLKAMQEKFPIAALKNIIFRTG